MHIAIRDVLLVHHDVNWCQLATVSLSSRGAHARWGATVEDVHRMISFASFDAVLLDIDTLSAGLSGGVVGLLGCVSPAPAVIAWSTSISTADAFELGRLGVRRLLATRPTPTDAFCLVEDALRTPLALEPQLRSVVGHVGIEQVVSDVRRVMLEQALGLARDNRSRTARMLSVSRQAVQQMVRRRPHLKDGSLARSPDETDASPDGRAVCGTREGAG